ncbi:MAG: hypothetical protein Fues2KO_33500 [Fuerstiella sp.]
MLVPLSAGNPPPNQKLPGLYRCVVAKYIRAEIRLTDRETDLSGQRAMLL